MATTRQILAVRDGRAILAHDGVTEWADCADCGANIDPVGGQWAQTVADEHGGERWDGSCPYCGAPPARVGLALAPGYYGTADETYVVSPTGAIWCVQSPDLAARGGAPVRVEGLPAEARRLADDLCRDLDVPARCWE